MRTILVKRMVGFTVVRGLLYLLCVVGSSGSGGIACSLMNTSVTHPADCLNLVLWRAREMSNAGFV